MDDKLYFKEMKEIATGSQENNTEKQKEGRWLEQQLSNHSAQGGDSNVATSVAKSGRERLPW